MTTQLQLINIIIIIIIVNSCNNATAVGNIQIDQFRSFRYLGTSVNGNNTLEEEIRERIVKGNGAFYANRALFKSKLVSRKSKLKLYWSVIRPVVV